MEIEEYKLSLPMNEIVMHDGDWLVIGFYGVDLFHYKEEMLSEYEDINA